MTADHASTISGSTSTIYDTLYPRWEQKVMTKPESFLSANSWFLQVHDFDPLRDDLMGACTLSITSEMLRSGEHTIPICGDYVTQLKLRFSQL